MLQMLRDARARCHRCYSYRNIDITLIISLLILTYGHYAAARAMRATLCQYIITCRLFTLMPLISFATRISRSITLMFSLLLRHASLPPPLHLPSLRYAISFSLTACRLIHVDADSYRHAITDYAAFFSLRFATLFASVTPGGYDSAGQIMMFDTDYTTTTTINDRLRCQYHAQRQHAQSCYAARYT